MSIISIISIIIMVFFLAFIMRKLKLDKTPHYEENNYD
ncbi:hypothetical protein SCTVLC_1329 [Serratia symbiotica SCt-VLC]|uniref:Uncharacterized protein n=1 Tax=Serratia symbiotica SCt-VLC TaxID=1347341 RepID=A0A068RB90_9GAMM|nr:hypothetical protein SCTVLC_1329 [Serratia symbiotica SCt-VLC]